jgi:two-component system, OmpR family, copper resistance phosphate regulon response regulator CusR
MKILIIEDSEKLRSTLKIGLSKMGYVVDDIGDGKTGYEFAIINDYDVIILDLMLPSMTGLEILSKVRSNKKNTHILILSAKNEIEDRVKGLRLGADDYLSKPFSFDELVARLNALMRRRSENKSSLIKVGSLEIDTLMKKVIINGANVDVTPKEYLILEYLCTNQGRVISHELLINQVYTSDDNVNNNTVEAHVSALRKKLKYAGTEKIIQTKRGFGYFVEKQ